MILDIFKTFCLIPHCLRPFLPSCSGDEKKAHSLSSFSVKNISQSGRTSYLFLYLWLDFWKCASFKSLHFDAEILKQRYAQCSTHKCLLFAIDEKCKSAICNDFFFVLGLSTSRLLIHSSEIIIQKLFVFKRTFFFEADYIHSGSDLSILLLICI